MIRGVTFDWWHTIAETPWPDYDARMRTARVEQIASALSAHRPRIEPEVLFRSLGCPPPRADCEGLWRGHPRRAAGDRSAHPGDTRDPPRRRLPDRPRLE